MCEDGDHANECRRRERELALTSDAQCRVCTEMRRGKCIHWGYSIESSLGVNNHAPWCRRFARTNVPMDPPETSTECSSEDHPESSEIVLLRAENAALREELRRLRGHGS